MIGNAVLERLKELLSRGKPRAEDRDELRLAAGALLVEAARMDEVFDAVERERIQSLIVSRFALSAEEAEDLVRAAEGQAEESVHLHGFTQVVKDALSYEERVELIEMLWEVVYADGALHDLEASLMRRIAGLLYVSDRDSGAARKAAMSRTGLVQD